MDAPLRLDKWLWAARFYKTRALAKQAIIGGKVKVDGEAAKVSRAIAVGMHLQLRRGADEEVVIVRGLSDRRGPASVAQCLYEETADSVQRREQARLLRKSAGALISHERPSKKQRRQIHRFKQTLD